MRRQATDRLEQESGSGFWKNLREFVFPRELDWRRENRPGVWLRLGTGLFLVAVGYLLVGIGGVLVVLKRIHVRIVVEHWALSWSLFLVALAVVSVGGLLLSVAGRLPLIQIPRRGGLRR